MMMSFTNTPDDLAHLTHMFYFGNQTLKSISQGADVNGLRTFARKRFCIFAFGKTDLDEEFNSTISEKEDEDTQLQSLASNYVRTIAQSPHITADSTIIIVAVPPLLHYESKQWPTAQDKRRCIDKLNAYLDASCSVYFVPYFNPYAAFKETDGGSCIGNSEIVYDLLKELLSSV
jgi:hypothetical protein